MSDWSYLFLITYCLAKAPSESIKVTGGSLRQIQLPDRYGGNVVSDPVAPPLLGIRLSSGENRQYGLRSIGRLFQPTTVRAGGGMSCT